MWFAKTFNSLVPRGLRCNLVNDVQFYSVFTPNYKKPIYRKEDQKVLYEKGEIKHIIHSPIKPAKSTETCSVFYDDMTCKFTNYIMRKGNKQLAKKILADIFENIKVMKLQEYYNTSHENRNSIILDPSKILREAVNNCSPILELRKISKGGISYQVPVPVTDKRAKFLSMNWLIESGQDKGHNEKFCNVMAKELINAAQNKGKAIKKKHDLHKLCEANRAYAHYRWV